MEYKGKKAEIVMMGAKEKVPNWNGELFVAVIKYKDDNVMKYDVIADSTDPRDSNDLPEVKTFNNKMEALNYALELERSKKNW